MMFEIDGFNQYWADEEGNVLSKPQEWKFFTSTKIKRAQWLKTNRDGKFVMKNNHNIKQYLTKEEVKALCVRQQNETAGGAGE